MQGADLGGAQMQGASLARAQMQGASLGEAKMQGADLEEAQMQGAYLARAEMQGADLRAARMSDDTNLTAANLRGAAVKAVNETTTARLQPHWDGIIASLETLPEGAPDHWVQSTRKDFDDTAFIDTWRAWAATLDPPVTIAPDWQP
jgi:uncharacterized protein YjbI with pentapeptide repeats